MDDDAPPTAQEIAADNFLEVLHGCTDIDHASNVLITTILCALRGNSPPVVLRFLKIVARELNVAHLMGDRGPVAEIPIATAQDHDRYVYLAGWNPAERLPN